MDVLKRIIELRDERNWSNYKLAKEANIPQSTMTNLLKHDNLPTIPTLISICNAFDITLLQFFSDKNSPYLSPKQEYFISKWNILTKEQKEIINVIMNEFIKNNKS